MPLGCTRCQGLVRRLLKEKQMSNKSYSIEILLHNIEFFFKGDMVGSPTELDESTIEHIENLIKEGYSSGELCVASDDQETEFRGWWNIAPTEAIQGTIEVATPATITDSIISLILNRVINHFSTQESGKMLEYGSIDLDEIEKNAISGAARIQLLSGQYVFVLNPVKVCEGLIEVFTPLENESKMLIPVSTIVSISFSE